MNSDKSSEKIKIERNKRKKKKWIFLLVSGDVNDLVRVMKKWGERGILQKSFGRERNVMPTGIDHWSLIAILPLILVVQVSSTGKDLMNAKSRRTRVRIVCLSTNISNEAEEDN